MPRFWLNPELGMLVDLNLDNPIMEYRHYNILSQRNLS